nr:uncharacterized protein LOC108132495 [Drosophila bipectinata]
MKILSVVLISVTFFITVALGSEESCYLTEEQEDDCAAVCHPIVKPLLRYFEKIQAKEFQFQKDYSELKKKNTDLEKKGQEHNGQISQFQKNYSDLQKKYSDLQESHSELQRRELELISQLQKDKSALQKDISDLQKDISDLQNRVIEVENLQAQIDSKNVEIKLLKDQISELNKTNELATKILRDDIAKLGEIVKNINSVNRTASPSPTRTVQQLPPPSKAKMKLGSSKKSKFLVPIRLK